jgi:sulfite reductase (NADPH) hemoprotein beta-component
MNDGAETFMIITANRLRDGVIVYMHVDNGQMTWSPSVSKATSFSSDDVDAALAQAKEAETGNLVVGIYAAEVTGNNNPLSAREKIRAHGPSIRYGVDAGMPDFSI